MYWAAPGLSEGMWDLIPWPGIEPGSPALGARSPSHWTTREVPGRHCLIFTSVYGETPFPFLRGERQGLGFEKQEKRGTAAAPGLLMAKDPGGPQLVSEDQK